MLHHSILMAFRRLKNSKSYSLINIFGLSISLMVCLLILLFTTYHFSFDKFIDNYQNSYRLISRYGNGAYNANTFACFEEDLKNRKEVKEMTVCYTQHNVSEVFANERTYAIEELAFVDESFLDYFGVKMLEGVAEKINQPNVVFITPKMAKTLFANDEPMGKTIKLRAFTRNKDELISFTVGGIVKPLPKNSHLGYEMLISKKGHFYPNVEIVKNRKVFAAATYVKLHESASIDSLEKALVMMPESKIGRQHGPPVDAFNHKLQPITTIHFTADTVTEQRPTVQRSTLIILLIVGALMLAMAIINFVNLYTANAATKKNESGIVRFLGGQKYHLWLNMAVEVLLMVFVSALFTLVLIVTFKSALEHTFFNHWEIPLFKMSFWVWAFSLTMLSAGLILFLETISFFNINKNISIIKPFFKSRSLRPLIVFQFLLVIALVGFTLLLNKQINFMQSKSLGYEAENVLILNSPQQNQQVKICRNELKKIPGVVQTAIVQHYPGYRMQDMNFSNNGNSFDFKFGMAEGRAIEALKIKPVKYFVPDIEKASEGWVINETFYKNLLQEYSKDQIQTSNFPQNAQSADEQRTPFKILGVVSDFHYASLHHSIGNFAFNIQPPTTRRNRFILVRYNQQNYEDVMRATKKTVAEIFPDKPFKYQFLSDELQQQYQSETTLIKLINAFTLLCIMVACLGLIGITLFMLDKRVKEIGIRKVNGASLSEIMVLINKDFVKWVAAAFILATPIAYYVMQKWLLNFAYKTHISWWIFVIAGLLAIVLAVATVSMQSYKAASRNPVDALRYE